MELSHVVSIVGGIAFFTGVFLSLFLAFPLENGTHKLRPENQAMGYTKCACIMLFGVGFKVFFG